jgi:hypothetical protein
MHEIARNLYEITYPLSIIGAQLGRRVTVIRLPTNKLIIHSTGPFTGQDIAAIKSLGAPAWLIDVTQNHDTFADIGRAAFPEIPYGVPEGFIHVDGERFSLASPPAEWGEQFQILELQGMPDIREHACYHAPTRTVIVADLVFNFQTCTPWTRQFFRWVSGIKQFPGVSRLFTREIKDKHAFTRSLQQLMQWDFDRLIVAHGQTVHTNAKQKLAEALKTASLYP